MALLVCQCHDPAQWALQGNKLKELLQKVATLHHRIDDNILPLQRKVKKIEKEITAQSTSLPSPPDSNSSTPTLTPSQSQSEVAADFGPTSS